MMYFSSTSRFATGLCIFVFCLLSGLVIDTASAADAYYDGNLGDTIDLHGVSYTGTQVYLFMTGPNLPANGVTLTDITQRADQGHFTTIDLNSNQEWSFKWDTARIQQLIDPGTYTVYITTEPEDLSHLGGTSTYKTLSVYLQDAGIPQGSSEAWNLHVKPGKTPFNHICGSVDDHCNASPHAEPDNPGDERNNRDNRTYDFPPVITLSDKG